MRQDYTVLLFFSDIKSSQLLSKLTEYLDSKHEILVIHINTLDEKVIFTQELLKIGVRFVEFDCRRLTEIPRTVKRILSVVKEFESVKMLVSGRYASYLAAITSIFKKMDRKILIRHHSRSNYRLRAIHALFLDILTQFRFDLLVCVSSIVRKTLIRYEFVPKRKCTVLSNPIEIDSLIAINRKTSEKGITNVGIVSRYEKYKGLKYSLSAINNLSESLNLNLLLADGLTSPHKEIAPILDELQRKGRLERLGWQSDMTSFYNKVDVLVHCPISKDSEAFGMVYIEGLAAGATCVFTRSGVLVDYGQFDDYIYWCDYKSSESIQNQLYKAISEFEQNKIRLRNESFLDFRFSCYLESIDKLL